MYPVMESTYVLAREARGRVQREVREWRSLTINSRSSGL